MVKQLRVFRPARAPYDAALEAQVACVQRLKSGQERPETGFLLLLTHPPVITVGRSGGESNVLVSEERLRREGVALRHVSRGGDVTYHGPGQIVGYPILRLDGRDRDVHAYLRRLEQVIIDALADFRIESGRRPGFTGVWAGEEKIAAIGVAITRWVTYHGFALNVDPDLGHFALINPCGITDRRVTSMARLLEAPVDPRRVEDALLAHFAGEFGFDEVVESRALPAWPEPALSHEHRR